MLQSGRETWFFHADERSIEKKGVSICLVYNGHNHYCPSLVLNREEFTRFQLEQLTTISGATIELIKQIDLKNIKEDPKVQQINQLENVLRNTLNVLGKKQPAPRSKRSLRSVLWGGAAVDAPKGMPEVPSAAGKKSSLPKRPVGRKLVYCDHCDYFTNRSQDLKKHLWAKHGLGDGVVCKQGDCGKANGGKGKRFSSKFNLETHVQSIHLGFYKYRCGRQKCKFATGGKQLYIDHVRKVHKKYMGSKPPNLKCKKCHKVMSGILPLKRHMKRDTCLQKRNFQCGTCAKWLISQEGLNRHKKIFHGKKKVPQCGRCGKLIASRDSMAKHMARHKENDKIQRLKQLEEHKRRLEQQGREFSQQVGEKLKKKLPAKKTGKQSASVRPKEKKSAPLAPRRSARGRDKDPKK